MRDRGAFASGLALLLALAAVTGLAGCGGETPVPEELLHVWRTDHPGYEDRYLDIRRHSVVFGTGGASSVGHPIERVELEDAEDDGFLCVLHYRTRDGGDAQLRLVYEPGPPQRLRFENRKETWVREEDATWLAKEG